MKKRIEPLPTVGVRHHFFVKHITPPKIVPTALPALTEQEAAEVKCNILLLRDMMPEFEEFVKELYAEGMIDGWRSLKVTLT